MSDEKRFFGLYRGLVVDIADPEKRLRVKARVPSVLYRKVTGWAWPCVPPGWSSDNARDLLKDHAPHGDHVFTDFNDGDDSSGDHEQTLQHNSDHGVAHAHRLLQQTPKVGEGVWIMFEGGDPEYPVWIGAFK